MSIEIRSEAVEDVAAIHALNAGSFPTDGEARLVDALRANAGLVLSLVAIAGNEVIGHIAFSPVTIDSGARTFAGLGLAPMAVAKSHRGRGVGGRLIAEGLERLRAHPFCVVLGHAHYYPRHGFQRASLYGIRWERPVPDDVFFVQELAPGGLHGVSGVVRYRPELDAV